MNRPSFRFVSTHRPSQNASHQFYGPRGNHAADGPEIRTIGVFLVEASDDVGCDSNERSKRRCRSDAVLAAVPGTAEDQGDLLEIVHEKLLRILVEVSGFSRPTESIRRKELLELLGQRRLGHATTADTEQLDLVIERRVLAIIERPHHVVSRGEIFITVQLAARQAHQVRCVQPSVLGVDGDEHLNDMVLRQTIEHDGRYAEILALKPIDVGMQRQETMLTVDGA